MKLRAWLWVAATLGLAVVVHLATLYAIPRVVMERVSAGLGTPNAMHQGKRPDASTRGIVRPSADLLYSICPYDLSAGRPLLVTGPVSSGAYWSVSAYDDQTNNFYVVDGRSAHGSFRFEINAPGSENSPPGSVTSPRPRGVVILRMLINGDAQLGVLEALRRKAYCGLR